MSDALATVVIANGATIATVLLSHYLSGLKHRDNSVKLEIVHKLVNQRMADALKEIKSLKDKLKEKE